MHMIIETRDEQTSVYTGFTSDEQAVDWAAKNLDRGTWLYPTDVWEVNL